MKASAVMWGITLATLLVAPHLTGSWVILATVWTVVSVVRLALSRLEMTAWKKIVIGGVMVLAILYLLAFWYANTYGT